MALFDTPDEFEEPLEENEEVVVPDIQIIAESPEGILVRAYMRVTIGKGSSRIEPTMLNFKHADAWIVRDRLSTNVVTYRRCLQEKEEGIGRRIRSVQKAQPLLVEILTDQSER